VSTTKQGVQMMRLVWQHEASRLRCYVSVCMHKCFAGIVHAGLQHRVSPANPNAHLTEALIAYTYTYTAAWASQSGITRPTDAAC
jgi:hypothetical protein